VNRLVFAVSSRMGRTLIDGESVFHEQAISKKNSGACGRR